MGLKMEQNNKKKDKSKKIFSHIVLAITIAACATSISYCLIKISGLEHKIYNQQQMQLNEQKDLGKYNNGIRKQIDNNIKNIQNIESALEKTNYELKLASPNSQDTKLMFDIQMAIYQADIFKNKVQTIYWLEKAYRSTTRPEQANAIKDKISLLNKTKNTNLEESLSSLRIIANKIPELEFTVHKSEQQKKQDEKPEIKSKASDYLINFLNKYMIISHDNDQNKRLWLSPSQKAILIQDILAMIYQAQWALLYQNDEIFSFAIDKSISLLKNINSPETIDLIGKLNGIKKSNPLQALPKIDSLLDLTITKGIINKKIVEQPKTETQEIEDYNEITPEMPEVSGEF